MHNTLPVEIFKKYSTFFLKTVWIPVWASKCTCACKCGCNCSCSYEGHNPWHTVYQLPVATFRDRTFCSTEFRRNPRVENPCCESCCLKGSIEVWVTTSRPLIFLYLWLKRLCFDFWFPFCFAKFQLIIKQFILQNN